MAGTRDVLAILCFSKFLYQYNDQVLYISPDKLDPHYSADRLYDQRHILRQLIPKIDKLYNNLIAYEQYICFTDIIMVNKDIHY